MGDWRGEEVKSEDRRLAATDFIVLLMSINTNCIISTVTTGVKISRYYILIRLLKH